MVVVSCGEAPLVLRILGTDEPSRSRSTPPGFPPASEATVEALLVNDLDEERARQLIRAWMSWLYVSSSLRICSSVTVRRAIS